MRYYNLQWYVDKINKGEKFSLARFGDGEFYCMWGKQGGNSNGCRYSPELRNSLLESLNNYNDRKFIYGMQRVLPQDQAKAEREYPEIRWHDTEIFSEAVAQGKLFPLIEALKQKRLVVVGNISIKKFMIDTFKVIDFIEVPPANAFDFNPVIPLHRNVVYLFSCGMAANVYVDTLHNEVDSWLIDVGHIWDPFVGNMSRCDLVGKTLQDINKNLYGTSNK